MILSQRRNAKNSVIYQRAFTEGCFGRREEKLISDIAGLSGSLHFIACKKSHQSTLGWGLEDR